MISSASLLRLAGVALTALSLSGCVTPRANPPISAAVLEARAAADVQADPCKHVSLAAISPMSVTFEFQSAVLSIGGRNNLDAAALWLGCAKDGQVLTAGYADARGTPQAQQALASSRAAVVQAFLQDKGIAADRLRIVPATRIDARGTHNADTNILLIRAQGGGW